ncbi:MAG: hypothetical protein V7637_2778 [Mycobacteriales bacterium]
MYVGDSGFDPVWTPTDPSAYTVRYGLRQLLFPLGITAGMLAFLVVASRGNRTNQGSLLFFGSIFVLVPGWLVWRGINRIRRGVAALGVDGSGVYLGEDDDGTPPELVPWAEIEAVVYYRGWSQSGRGGRAANNHVGVIVKRADGGDRAGEPGGLADWTDATLRLRSRRVQGWQLDVRRLTAAVQRFAPRVPVRRAPDTDEAVGVHDAVRRLRTLRWPPPGSVPYRGNTPDAGYPYTPPAGPNPYAGPAADPYGQPGTATPYAGPDRYARPAPGPYGQPAGPDQYTEPGWSGPFARPGEPVPYGPAGTGGPGGRGPDWGPYGGAGVPGGPRPAGRPRVTGLGCLGVVGVVIIWLLFAVLPLGFVDDLVGQATRSTWSLFTGQPTRISVPPGTALTVEVDPDSYDRGVPGVDPVSLACSTRDGDAAPVQLPAPDVVAAPRGANGRLQLYNLVTNSGRFEITCTWTGGFGGTRLVRAGRGWMGIVVFATRLAWFVLVTFVLVLLFRRIMRVGRPPREP